MGHVIRRMRSGRVRIFNGVDGNCQFGATPLQILGLGTLIRPSKAYFNKMTLPQLH